MFHPAGVEVNWASFAKKPPFPEAAPKRGAKRRGYLYELKAQKYLMKVFGKWYWPSPWIAYRADGQGRTRYCQPDGIHFDPEAGRITVVEVKYSHTLDAYFQLQEKYLPVLQHMFPASKGWEFCALEVVRWFDPLVKFPHGFQLAKNPRALKPGVIGVHIYYE